MSARPKEPFVYTGEHLREVAFPLGGIGTGCVSLEGRGALQDWEIFNRPNKGSILRMTFPVLWWEGGCRVLQGPRQKDFVGDSMGFWGYGHGQIRQQGDGLPHFRDVIFRGTFPFARIEFIEPDCPLRVELEAWSPFVPRDARSSGFPVACLTYRLKNVSKTPLRASLAWLLHNAVGLAHEDAKANKATNEFRDGKHCRGLLFSNSRFESGDPLHGTLALTTDWPDVSHLSYLLRGGWFDSLHDFWDMFSPNGELDASRDLGPGAPVSGALGMKANLAPGESVELPFLISWCFPTSERYWEGEDPAQRYRWTNPYSKQWPTAWESAAEFFERRKELHEKTLDFERSIFASKLPDEVKESISATASILHSPTCLFQEDGTFWAWEGCSAKEGCCAGSCTHVWNYAQTLAYLFPDLHRSMRKSEYLHSFAQGDEGKKGAIAFRIPLPMSEQPKLWHAASDGQLGGVVQLYRDWKLCGDEGYLRKMWPHAKKALEYAWVMWDRDKDGLVDGDQHNTYDINFQGPNPLTQGFYLAALRAGEEIAKYIGETEKSAEYRQLFQNGSKKAEEAMFNGEYFEQAYDALAPDAEKYQHGKGCLSDQMFGQWCAHIAGLGYLYDPAKVKASLKAIYKHNFKDPLGDHANMQRIYAVADEPGLILCSWPKGGRPRYPFPYSDEVWTGIEYQVAGHMIFEGLVEEGLSIVRGARKRHDGARRNPYNEFECGSHYARAMSAWGLVLAYAHRDKNDLGSLVGFL